jgi:aspartokinase-like uncharacterized kinase
MIVVKVGGSLFDHPRLVPELRRYLIALPTEEVWLVPGGGSFVEAIRKLDAIHQLGEETSHWLALRALEVTGEFLKGTIAPGQHSGLSRPSAYLEDDDWESLVPNDDDQDTPTQSEAQNKPSRSRVHVLDCFGFAREDELRQGALPHSWSVTSDSIAARAAVVYGAERLVLLKSLDVPAGTPWAEAAKRGAVDAHFPQVVAKAKFPIEVVNFRRVLDSLRV